MILVSSVGYVGVDVAAAATKCDTGQDLKSTECSLSVSEVQALQTSASSEGFEYAFEEYCDGGVRGILCRDPVPCIDNQQDSEGFVSWVMRRTVAPAGDWVDLGTYCDDGSEREVITEAKVVERMREHDWATARLMVQPVEGRTLVNFATNFYTRLPEEQSTTFAMFGRQVTIVARPVEYTWRWGDDSDAGSTPDPGIEVTGATDLDDGLPEEAVSHEYLDAGVVVTPSVDVTYQGEYQVDGGEFLAIRQTLTLPGESVALEVIEAQVHLVG